MAEDSDDKTEEASAKKLSDARKEGDVPQSQEVKIIGSLIGTFIIVAFLLPGLAKDIMRLGLPFIEQPHTIEINPQNIRGVMIDVVLGFLKAMLVPLLVMLFLVAAVAMAQTKGPLWVPKKLAPDFKKINPLTGLKNMFSMQKLFDLAKALAKILLVSLPVVWLLWPRVNDFENLAKLDLMGVLAYLDERIYSLVLMTLVMALLMAIGDFLFQRWRFMEKMKMSKQEVRDEHKQQEGDPMVKGRIARLRMQKAKTRMMASVPTASVVVTNPTHYAVALKYDMDSMAAPVLVAKGVDHLAKTIRELAEKNDVPLVENPPLARALYATVELDQEVPPDHYKAVAEVISYVMRLKGKNAR